MALNMVLLTIKSQQPLRVHCKIGLNYVMSEIVKILRLMGLKAMSRRKLLDIT